MRDAYAIVRRPVVTEKGTFLKEQGNQYLFEVARDANKIEVGKAVETLFRVKVVNVRTLAMRGKRKRLGRFQGRTSDWKKAIVTLKAGDTIELFEGV